MWAYLKNGRLKSLKFKRQVVIGKYIADFSCFEKKLVIELDGGEHSEKNVHKIDVEKDKFLKSRGYIVLRFWNNEVQENVEGVLERIRQVVA